MNISGSSTRARTVMAVAAVIMIGAAITAGMSTRTFGGGQAGESTAEYMCPDCGCENDGKTYDKPGKCEACHMKLIREDETRNVAILVFEGVQIIDYTGPYEVFGQVGPFNVYTVSETGETLSTAMDMSVNPTYSFANAPEPDILVVPGGAAHVAYDNPKVVEWVTNKGESAEHVLSVCNGAFILARAGLLDGKKATTFYGLIDDLREFAPKTEVVTDQRFVDNGKVITSAGLSSGIDASLYLVSKIRGDAQAKNLALHLEYEWNPESTFARAALADLHLPDISAPDGLEAELVSTSGNRDQWERRFAVTGDISTADLLSYVVKEVSGLKGWSLVQTGEASSNGSAEWIYTEGEGGKWSATTSVEPSDHEDTQIVSMKIERADTHRAAKR